MKTLMNAVKTSKLQGIHIHCPEGAVPKDGPSAGTAITDALYSLINKKRIKNTIAITGDKFTGQVTAIGGLDLKILEESKQELLNLFIQRKIIKISNSLWKNFKIKMR